MGLRLLRALCVVALAVGSGTAALPGPPAAGANQKLAFGLTDRWEPQIASDESQLDLHSAIVGLFLNWSTAEAAPTVRWMDWVRSRRAAPMLDLVPPSTVRLANIASGSQDGHLRAFARAFAAWGHPMLLRVLPEMNGKWEPYSPGRSGQTTQQYVAAFRHIVTVFRDAGATNVKMMWNPNRVFKGSTPLTRLWPGARYVDWAGIDAYNYHDSAHGTFSPYGLLAGTVSAIRRLTAKPMMVAELGCAPFAGKPRWIARSLPTATSLGLAAVVWFDEAPGSGPNWRLDSQPRPATVQAAKTAVHDPGVAWPGHGIGSTAQIDQFVETGNANNG